MALTIADEAIGAARLLTLEGRLDNDTAADLELAMQDQLDAGAAGFVLDLAGLQYVSSAGLQVLLAMAQKTNGKGGLRLAGLQPSVRQVFDAAGATPLLAIFADRAAALGGSARKVEENRLASIVAKLLETPAAAPSAPADPQLVERVADLLGGEDDAAPPKARR
jgi:anti-anti-sigma factor